MFCKKCGKENKNEAIFCADCGLKIIKNDKSIKTTSENKADEILEEGIFIINDKEKLLTVLSNEMKGWDFVEKEDNVITCSKGIISFKLKIISEKINLKRVKKYLCFKLPFLIIIIMFFVFLFPCTLLLLIPNHFLNKKIKQSVLNALYKYEEQQQ